ncbi:hypothetical protein DXA96_11805 [Lachnospiraceae bacterium OF09-33XD]|nr:hypothetical protein DXA96_11805 [Lachnospiraceae bacterium OF09-33XD]
MSVGAAPSPMVDGSSVGDASGVAAGVEDGFLPAEAEEAELLPVTVSSLLQPPAARAVRHRAAMTGYIKRFFITTSLLFFLVQFYHHFLKKTSIRGVKL